MQWLVKKIFILFGLDIRSLALLRIGTALLIIGECIHRAGDVFAFNTDAGVLPRTILIDTFSNQWHVSLNMISGLWEVQILLLILSFVFGCALLIGWHTRVATFASWILLLSFQARNPLILQNSDTVLRMILFWALFLPWGAATSVDSLHKPANTDSHTTILTPATFAYMLQILLIYVFAVAFKTGPEWTTEWTGVYYALSAGGFATSFGSWFSHYAVLLPYLTKGVMFFEIWMPVLFFVPFRIQIIRTFLVLAMVVMHIGMGMMLELGLFSWVMVVALLGLLPGGVWDTIDRIWRRYHSQCVLYFDGECGFCNHGARLIAMFLFVPGIPVLPAQENKTALAYMKQEHSWVFLCGEKKYTKTKAFFMLAKHSPVFGIFAWVFDRSWIRNAGDVVYDWVSARRKQICTQEVVHTPSHAVVRIVSWSAQMIAVLCLVYIIIWNLSTLPASTVKIAPFLHGIAQVFRFDQKWDMFAPSPIKETGWFVMPGKLVSGQKVDVYGGELVSFEPPALASKTYKNYRWRKYLLNLADARYSKYRLYYGRYLCRQWNEGKDPEHILASFEMIYVRQVTLLDGKKGHVDQVPLWNHKCF